MNSFKNNLESRLAEQKSKGLYRQRQVVSSAQGSNVVLQGKTTLSFCSNDYLGLANHPEIIKSFKQGLDDFGVGSGGSHLITGHSSCHHALEEELASFTGRSRALVFSSGYMANVGIVTALLGKNDAVFEDRLNHASLLDGGLFSGARFKRYSHLDMSHLEKNIGKHKMPGQRMIISDGVFSMDGDQADVGALLDLAENNQAILMIDDAHGFGCLGKHGGGVAEEYKDSRTKNGKELNQDNLQVLVGTFGKAFGTSGAFVAGSEALVESLIQFCRPYIYTTAMPAALAEATRCSLSLVQNETWRREALQAHIKRFRGCCTDLGFRLTDSKTAIQSVVIGDVNRTMQASKCLAEKGIMVSAIRPPTVPNGSSRLRFTFSAVHSETQVQILCDAMESIAHLAAEPE